MRFVDTQTISLKEIPDSEVHSLMNGYAILSHRWLDDEVTFNDLQSHKHLESRAGSVKLLAACEIARTLGFDLIWIDTCCIDKSSSTELSETINSMYRWYSDAKLCLAYLPDVLDTEGIASSVWFGRGWTLQELIAPASVSFYNAHWKYLGSKHDLTSILSVATKIPAEVLLGTVRPQTCSVAQRMSWAANRTTTRVEDMAYSLLGLFDVSMAMIYGEREQAFVRLQEEIVKKSADQSVFAWNLDADRKSSGLLAPTAAAFQGCHDVFATSVSQGFSSGNTGLSIDLPTKPYALEMYVVALEVSREGSHRVGILLARLKEDGQYTRVCDSHGLGLLPVDPDESWTVRHIQVQQNAKEEPSSFYQGFWIRQLRFPAFAEYEPQVISRGLAAYPDRIQLLHGVLGTAGVVWMRSNEDSIIWPDSPWFHARLLLFGFDIDFNPVCLVSQTGQGANVRPYHAYMGIQNALESQPGSYRLISNPIFDHEWMSREGSRPKLGDGWDQGYLVLKGDRREGLEANIELINLNITIKRYPDHGIMMESLGSSSQRQDVWTVDVTPTGDESPERSLWAGCCKDC